jgi:hypothetical protein
MVLMQPATSQRSRILSALDDIDAALDAISAGVTAIAELTDAELLLESARHARHRDAIGTVGAMLAGEIARRSAPEFGSNGLAQRSGFRTPIELVKVTTRATGREATSAVRAGTLLVESQTEGVLNAVTGEIVEMSEPWMAPVANALAAGTLSLAASEAIRAGIGVPNSAVTVEALRDAAKTLCGHAATVDPDRLQKLARSMRDAIDAAGVAIREEERREQRSLKLISLPDGMGRLIWTMDPETFATVKNVYDRATSPKLGGVRFVGEQAQEQRDAILADARTPGQLASDAFTHLLAAGADADSSVLIGTGAPIVKLTTTLAAVQSAQRHNSDGAGYFEGQFDAVSIATVQRALCTGGSEEIIFGDDGQPLDEGREHRLFTRKQKSVLAVRDGGCRWPGCERPPSWCEAHHILWWSRDRGPTHVANGILLCKHHHLLLHNNGWQIEKRSGLSGFGESGFGESGFDEYWLTPPAIVDPDREAIPMPSKSVAGKHVHRDRAGV